MNMYEMLREENEISREERAYKSWLDKVQKIAGRVFDEDGLAYDLYADGCDAEDAAQELITA